MTGVTIGARAVGNGHPVFVIAEAGSNHNGSLDQALALIDVAADAGADAVKFQTFRADALYARGAGRSDYLGIDRSIVDIIREMEMPFEWLPELAARCAKRGVLFLSTPFDERAVDLLEPLVPAYKLASYELTHHLLAARIASKGKPVLASTGASTLEEVRELVRVLHENGNDQLVLLQCTACYPAPVHALNLRAIPLLRDTFGFPVGLSDHSRDPLVAPIAAVALGAAVIEKHFTLDNRLRGPDHAFAVEPAELRAMVAAIRSTERALGRGEKEPLPEEQELRSFARRSIFATRDIAAGEPLSASNTAVLRCGKLGFGLHPRELSSVLGHRAGRAIAADSLIRWDDLT